MVYCPDCGEQAFKNSTFCDYCGGDLSQAHPGLVESPDDASPEGLARTGEGASSLRRYVLVSLCSIFGAFLFGAFVFLGLAGEGGGQAWPMIMGQTFCCSVSSPPVLLGLAFRVS